MCVCVRACARAHARTVGSPFMTGLRSQIIGCKWNRSKTSAI